MNTKHFLLLLTFIISVNVGFSNDSNLSDLIEDGLLNITVKSLGKHSGNCLRIAAVNNIDSTIEARIEPGRVFKSENTNEQDIIVTQELLFVVHPLDKTEVDVFGYCCQSQNHSPNVGAEFKLSHMADEQLIKVAEYLNEHRELPISQQQSAIWCLSDCAPISSISRLPDGNTDLNVFISDMLGIDPPWYTTVHKQTANAVFSERVEKLYGDIDFVVHAYTTVSVTVKNESGEMVTTLLQEAEYGPGDYTYPISVWVDFWQSGLYSIEISSNNTETLAMYEFQI